MFSIMPFVSERWNLLVSNVGLRSGVAELKRSKSQSGKRTRGDDINSLSRAFLYAGSPSVVASLWSVDDDATGEVMVAFYRHLKTGMAKLKPCALRKRTSGPNTRILL
jgi:hypothetical protein